MASCTPRRWRPKQSASASGKTGPTGSGRSDRHCARRVSKITPWASAAPRMRRRGARSAREPLRRRIVPVGSGRGPALAASRSPRGEERAGHAREALFPTDVEQLLALELKQPGVLDSGCAERRPRACKSHYSIAAHLALVAFFLALGIVAAWRLAGGCREPGPARVSDRSTRTFWGVHGGKGRLLERFRCADQAV
jgi:hypothetical protein